MNEKRINILHLQNYVNLSCGVSKTIYLIAKNTSLQFNHYLACFNGDGLSRFESLNINPLVLKGHKSSPFRFIIHFLKLYSICKQNKINIIHSHHRYFGLLAFLISRILDIKTITSVQSKVHNHKLFSYKSDMLIACSNSIKSHLINKFKIYERRIKVIYNCVDPAEIVLTKTKTELMNLLKIRNNKFVIGFFGRLDFKEKGVDVLLKAFLNLSKSNINLFLLLIGDGIDANKTREFITQNNLKAKVIKPQVDIFNYYQLLDLFILPSRIEPFGIVMIEAGIMNIPFVGSNIDGIAELVENEKDGLLFESGNFYDLQNKILKIYNEKNFVEKLNSNLYSKVLTGYTVQSIVPQYEKLYLNL